MTGEPRMTDDLVTATTTARDETGLTYIRDHYRVPAAVGQRVTFAGVSGVIVGAIGSHLLVDFGDGVESVLHPTWNVEYVPSERAQ